MIVMGDFNAKVCNGIEDDAVSSFGLATRNERGDCIVQYSVKNQMIITNSFFLNNTQETVYIKYQ